MPLTPAVPAYVHGGSGGSGTNTPLPTFGSVEHGVLDGDRLPGATSGGVSVYPAAKLSVPVPLFSVEFGSTVSVPTAVKFTLPLAPCDVSSPVTTMKPAFTVTLSSPPAASADWAERYRSAGQRGLKGGDIVRLADIHGGEVRGRRRAGIFVDEARCLWPWTSRRTCPTPGRCGVRSGRLGDGDLPDRAIRQVVQAKDRPGTAVSELDGRRESVFQYLGLGCYAVGTRT